jgi:hypothetical protein
MEDEINPAQAGKKPQSANVVDASAKPVKIAILVCR